MDHLKEVNTGLTAADIPALVAAAVAAAIKEARKPDPPTEQQLSALQMKQEQRAAMAADVMRTKENRLAIQRICSHEHSQREGGGSHGVWVREEDPASPGYVYCQKCEAKVRPNGGNEGTKRADRTAIYDTALFNKLFQDCGPTGLMG